jgi:hypothetical protein
MQDSECNLPPPYIYYNQTIRIITVCFRIYPVFVLVQYMQLLLIGSKLEKIHTPPTEEICAVRKFSKCIRIPEEGFPTFQR